MTQFEAELAESIVEPTSKKGKATATTMTRSVELPYLCVGVDLGTTEVRMAMSEDVEKVAHYPSVVKEVEATEIRGLTLDLGMGELALKDNLKMLVNGKGYFLGQAAIDAGEVLTPGKSKLENVEAKLVAAAVLLGIFSGELAACFCIPFKSEVQYRTDLKTLVEALEGKEIKVHLFGKDFSYFIAKVFVLPEGAAPLYWAQKHLGARFSGSRSVVIDGGHWTLDCTDLKHNKKADRIDFNPTNSISLPAGSYQFSEMVAAAIGMPAKDSPRLIKAIAEGVETFRFKGANGFKTVDLNDTVLDLKPKFLNQTKGNIFEWFPDEEIDSVYLVGGMCKYFQEELEELFLESGFSVMTINPSRLSSALSTFIFCQQMVALQAK